MANHYHRYNYIKSEQPPSIPTTFVDAKDDPVEIGSLVLFYMQGAIREGKIKDISCKWKEAYSKGSGQWYAEFKIQVEITIAYQNDYPVGHISTLKSFDIIWKHPEYSM